MSEKSKRQDGDPQNPKGKAIDEHGKVDKEKLEENQERLGVDDEHITDEMKKGDRGTYP